MQDSLAPIQKSRLKPLVNQSTKCTDCAPLARFLATSTRLQNFKCHKDGKQIRFHPHPIARRGKQMLKRIIGDVLYALKKVMLGSSAKICVDCRFGFLGQVYRRRQILST